MNEVISETLGKWVREFKDKGWIQSWHFFREPEIRLRFQGEEEDIMKVRDSIESRLKGRKSKGGEVFAHHILGSRGIENEEYTGEASEWLND